MDRAIIEAPFFQAAAEYAKLFSRVIDETSLTPRAMIAGLGIAALRLSEEDGAEPILARLPMIEMSLGHSLDSLNIEPISEKMPLSVELREALRQASGLGHLIGLLSVLCKPDVVAAGPWSHIVNPALKILRGITGINFYVDKGVDPELRKALRDGFSAVGCRNLEAAYDTESSIASLTEISAQMLCAQEGECLIFSPHDFVVEDASDATDISEILNKFTTERSISIVFGEENRKIDMPLKNINIIYMDKYLNKSYNKISELQKYSAHIIFDGDKILNTFKLRDMSIAGCEIYSKIINLVGEF